jgi:glycerol-3-phosphate cytidylyltransferase
MKENKILYTGGTFDLFHYGHISFLKQCYSVCPNIIVSLNTDEFVLKYKNKSPIMTYEEREISLLECKYVSRVIPNVFGEDSKRTILSISPDFIAVGDDWCRKDYYKQMNFTKEWLESQGIVLLYIPYTDIISTSSIINRILNRKS